MKEKKADIAIWGRVPPPLGGMAVHLRRLTPHLKRVGVTTHMYSIRLVTPHHPEVTQVSHRKLRWFLSIFFGRSEKVHYVLTEHSLARAAAVLLTLRSKKVVLRVGGGRISSSKFKIKFWDRLLLKFAFSRATAVIGVSEEICSRIKLLGGKRVIHVPGFIYEYNVNQNSPPDIEIFLSKNQLPVLLSVGEIRDPWDNDLWGSNFLLNLLMQNTNLRVVFCAYRISKDTNPQTRLRNEISKRGLQGRYLILEEVPNLLTIMRHCQLFVRPTTTDGDSNSIREALNYGLPVIASDCVERPPGVITYPSGNIDALSKTVNTVLDNLDFYRNEISKFPQNDNAIPIVNLFLELLGKTSTKSDPLS